MERGIVHFILMPGVTVVATNLRKGSAIKVKGDSGVLLEVEHRTPGKGAGFVQVIMRSFTSGKSKDLRFAASEKVEILNVDRRKLEFSYSDPSGYYFMDPESFEMTTLPAELLEESKDLLVENLSCEVLYVEGNPMSAELPPAVELTVTQSPEGLKGDTANNPTKAATLETGKLVQVPLFIKEGERIRIDTRTGKYLGRA
jgi:elongation factor P